uniref:DUF148 domain-containing protein n=1 Tax=Heligmosomoides polygyrus TaxID=6339 RepID=A0A183GSW4_HELPZ
MNIALVVLVLGAALCDAYRGSGRGDGGDRPGSHHRGPPPPPYLEEVSEEAREEYFTIVSNMEKTIAAQKQEILEWGRKHGIQVQSWMVDMSREFEPFTDKVEEFNKKRESIGDEMKQNVTDLIAVLPSALQQVSAIRENEDQTRTQQEEALRELKAADPKVWLIRGVNCLAQFNLNLLQVHDVLRFIFHQFKPRHPHGKPSHQGIGGFERQGGFGGPREMGSEVGGDHMTGRPRGHSGFEGRPGFGGFQGYQMFLVSAILL